MTEYDYSPEGYERYMSTQNRVSNWVQEQNTRMKTYTNPYTRSVSTPPAEASHRTSSRHDDRSYHQAIPRSITSSHTYHTAQPSNYYHSASTTKYASPTVVYPTQQGYSSAYRTYQYDGSSREIVIPPPRPGETYVIIPPKGRRVEVIDTRGSSRSSSKSSSRSPISPTKKDQPLFKRLFTGFGQPPSSKLTRSSTSSHRERARSY